MAITPKNPFRPTQGLSAKELVQLTQQRINHFSYQQKLRGVLPRLAEDGVRGPATNGAIHQSKLLLGYVAKYADTSIDDLYLRRLLNPSVGLNPVQIARGIARRVAARRAPTGRAALAQRVLNSPNARFVFVSPTGGSAAVGLRQQAAGHLAHVAATGGNVNIDTRILAFCAELSSHGVTYINCIVNGRHMNGSQHYAGDAVDIDKGSHSLGFIYAVAEKHGLRVLNEDRYHYHVHT